MPRPTSSQDLSTLVAGRAPSDEERRVWATRRGIQLLILAVLLQWIPLIEYLGLMVGGLGVVYVIRGRRAFGVRHERFIWVSVVLFVATEVAAFALDNQFTYALAVAAYTHPGPEAAAVAVVAYDGMAVGSSAIAVFLGVSYVLLLFDLEDREGRRWLLAGMASQIGVSLVLSVGFLLPMVQQSVPLAYTTSPPDAAILSDADSQIRGLSVLRLFDMPPAVLFAWGYACAVRRIDRGEVPLRRVGQPSGGPS